MLTELEIFKLCFKDKPNDNEELTQDSNSKILEIMDKLTQKSHENTREKVKEYVKIFYRVWNGLIKFTRAQVNQGKLVSFSLLGSFYLINSDKNDESNHITKAV